MSAPVSESDSDEELLMDILSAARAQSGQDVAPQPPALPVNASKTAPGAGAAAGAAAGPGIRRGPSPPPLPAPPSSSARPAAQARAAGGASAGPKASSAGLGARRAQKAVNVAGVGAGARARADAARSGRAAARPGVAGRAAAAGSVDVDRTSGFRITGRLIEAARVDASMRGRRFYQLKELPRVGEAALNEAKRDWVTIAVVTQASRPQAGQGGSKYIIWTLNDLDGASISLILSKGAYDAHWKDGRGCVVAVINPVVLPAKERNRNIALRVSEPAAVAILGRSADLGTCAGVKKDGGKCSMPVNVAKCGYCEYHAPAAFKRRRAERAELNLSGGGRGYVKLQSSTRNLSQGTFSSSAVLGYRAAGRGAGAARGSVHAASWNPGETIRGAAPKRKRATKPKGNLEELGQRIGTGRFGASGAVGVGDLYVGADGQARQVATSGDFHARIARTSSRTKEMVHEKIAHSGGRGVSQGVRAMAMVHNVEAPPKTVSEHSAAAQFYATKGGVPEAKVRRLEAESAKRSSLKDGRAVPSAISVLAAATKEDRAQSGAAAAATGARKRPRVPSARLAREKDPLGASLAVSMGRTVADRPKGSSSQARSAARPALPSARSQRAGSASVNSSQTGHHASKVAVSRQPETSALRYATPSILNPPSSRPAIVGGFAPHAGDLYDSQAPVAQDPLKVRPKSVMLRAPVSKSHLSAKIARNRHLTGRHGDDGAGAGAAGAAERLSQASATRTASQGKRVLAGGATQRLTAKPARAGESSKPGKGKGKGKEKKSEFLSAFGAAPAPDSAAGRMLAARQARFAAEAEAEKDDELQARLGELAESEALAEKMEGVTELQVTVYVCHECVETFEVFPQSCKAEGHVIHQKKKTKHFLVCSNCKNWDTVIGGNVAMRQCARCGKMAWKKRSVYSATLARADRAAGKEETLAVRGEEHEFSLRKAF